MFFVCGGAGASCEGGIINDSTLYVAEFFRHPSFSLLFFLGYGFSPFTWISPRSSLVPVQLQLLRPLRWSHILVVIQTNSPLFTWPRPCWWESLPMSFVLPMVVCALVGPLHGVVVLFLSFSSSIKFIYLIFFFTSLALWLARAHTHSPGGAPAVFAYVAHTCPEGGNITNCTS